MIVLGKLLLIVGDHYYMPVVSSLVVQVCTEVIGVFFFGWLVLMFLLYVLSWFIHLNVHPGVGLVGLVVERGFDS